MLPYDNVLHHPVYSPLLEQFLMAASLEEDEESEEDDATNDGTTTTTSSGCDEENKKEKEEREDLLSCGDSTDSAAKSSKVRAPSLCHSSTEGEEMKVAVVEET